MPSKPVQRSLKYLRDQGWSVAIVERWRPIFDKETKQMRPFGVRVDAFGIGDLLACLPRIPPIAGQFTASEPGKIALVQATDATSFSKHKIKILEQPDLTAWKAAGGVVLLHGWRLAPKDGVRGARKVWTLREEAL